MKKLFSTLVVLLALTLLTLRSFALAQDALSVSGEPRIITTASTVDVIDTNVPPFVPNGYTVEEHKKQGLFNWDQNNVTLYVSLEQRDGKQIIGHELREELAEKAVLNANVLDYLLKNKYRIPEEWKGWHIFFWGTVYRDPRDVLVVCYLRFQNGTWIFDYRRLFDDFSGGDSAILRVR
ncbi:MAG: hypothetical protein HYT27_01775 [Parcubacteria group bacterium]|nr:hypothetical protein [Parcubacteria group bacterium]